jgi:hypothetical protein
VRSNLGISQKRQKHLTQGMQISHFQAEPQSYAEKNLKWGESGPYGSGYFYRRGRPSTRYACSGQAEGRGERLVFQCTGAPVHTCTK